MCIRDRLELANYWLDNDDQDPITSDVFAKRITMGELAFRNDGSIEVYYDDDDIFWGHCIIAHIDADGIPVDEMCIRDRYRYEFIPCGHSVWRKQQWFLVL